MGEDTADPTAFAVDDDTMAPPKEGYHSLQRPAGDLEEQKLPPHSSLLLFLLTLPTIGSHYGKHSLSSLAPEIMATLSIPRTEYGLLFSSQSLPGIILPVLCGLALTYIPYPPAAIFLTTAIMLSTTLCALAVAYKSYVLLLIGRLLFGLCDGALTTLQGAVISSWFRRRVGTGFGAMLFVSRLSSFAGLSLPALVSEKGGLVFAMWFSVVVCIPPLLSAIAYAFYDARYREYALLNDEGEDLPTPTFPISRAGLFNLLRCFTTSFWLVCYLWVVVAGIVFSSLHFTTDAFEERFGFSAVKSGLLSGSLVLVAGLSSPVIGVLQDRIGRRATILTTCCGLLSGGCALCALALTKFGSHIALYTGLTFMAIGFAGAPVTLMSCVALSVEGFVIAAALGLYKGTENAGLTVLHVSLGAMRDVTGGYVWAFFLLAGVGLTGVLASLSLGRRSPHLGKGTGAASSEEAF